MEKPVMTDYEVHELFPRQYAVILVADGEIEFIGSLSDCLSWIELNRLEINIKRFSDD